MIAEAYESLVESGVPARGKQEAVVHVEPVGVVAFRPRHNVRRAQPGPAQRCRSADTAAPVVHKEDVLANAPRQRLHK